MPEEKRYYVYTLTYPKSMGSHVFYVGTGTGKRIDQHEGNAKIYGGSNRRKMEAINTIREAGEQIVKEKVAFFEMRGEALLYEQELILRLKPLGYLTNILTGTGAHTRTDEQLKKMEEEWNEMLRRRGEATRRYYAQLREEKRLQSLSNNRDNS